MKLTSKGRFAVTPLVDFGCIAFKKKSKCLTHNLWNKLTNHIFNFLNSISIEDVMTNSYDCLIVGDSQGNFSNINELKH